MYWTIKFKAGLVWVEVGFWRDKAGVARVWTYRTRDEAMTAMDLLRAERPGRYKLGRSPVPPPPKQEKRP